jgi:7-cyano-7-deazaguanine synthase
MSVLLLSGGLDSAVLLAREVAGRGQRPFCVGFGYGQRHRKELWCAAKIAKHYGCEYQQEVIPIGIFRGSALTFSGPVPHGHFEDPIQKATVVPNRNMVLLALAAALAVGRGENEILFAAHAGDARIYADCRLEFVNTISWAMDLACGVTVLAPFLAMTKRDIVQLGRELAVPMEMTWSCYEGGEVPCGLCGACCERNEAMA